MTRRVGRVAGTPAIPATAAGASTSEAPSVRLTTPSAVDNVLVGLLVDTVTALTYPRWLRSCTRTARDRRIGVSARE